MEEQLKKLLLQAEGFMGKNLTNSDPQFKAWKNAVVRFCENVYGPKSSTTEIFKKRIFAPMVYVGDTPDSTFVKFFEKDMAASIEDLKNLLSEIGLYSKSDNSQDKVVKSIPGVNVNINNTNSNTNNNSIINSIDVLSIEEIKESLEENSFLSLSDKEELLLKLEEIKKLSESNLSKTKKWNIGREIIAFILNKGADIAIMFIPQILMAIQR